MAQSVWAFPGGDGKLLYKPLPLGDKIGDYSNVGYMAGSAAIPDVPTQVTVSPVAGDDQTNIQNAINAVQAMPLDAGGFRGTVLLNPGTYEIPGTLNITTSGVVLRGSGQGQTILLATGTQKDTTVQLNGNGARTAVSGSPTRTITDKYVPVGAISFTVNDASNFAVGDTVIVDRDATANWIHDIGMDLLTNPWTSRTVSMDRTVTRVDGNVITLDAPITQAIDQNYGGATVWEYQATGRISNVGVEYITGRSTYDDAIRSGNDRVDENHAEHFIGVDGVLNGWVRNVTSEFYGYSCVNMTGPSKFVTVQDSQCLDPVSVVAGGRRYSFNMGDSTNVLWKNLYTRSGRHDYVQGSEVTGPNVVVDSRADAARSDTGPHHRYSTGTLWDNLDVNGHSINIQNRHNSGSGHGWAGANQVVWNSEANSFTIQNIGVPVSARNWAIGNIGSVNTGSPGPKGSQGIYDSHGTKVDTRSLFHAQNAERQAVDNFALRETRVGDADNYAGGDPADGVNNAEAAWRAAVQTASGQTPLGLDVAGSANQLVPLTFTFGIDPGTYVAGASLSIGYKAATAGSSAGDTIYFENATRRYTWAELGVPAPTADQGATVIDLAKLLPALQDGKLNIAVSGNTAIDWATLNFQTASITSPKRTTITAAEDAYVDQANPTSNFGTNTSLFTKRNGATDNRDSYLKWNVTSVTGLVTRAHLRLTPTAVGVAPSAVTASFGNATGAIFNRVSFVPSDAWTEAGINWNNRPAADPFFREFMAYPNEPVIVDVTALVRAAQAGDKTLSLLLNTYVDNASSQNTYASSENGNASIRPQLIIETRDAVTAVADATVRGGASAGLNFGTTADLSVKNDTAAAQDNDREAFLRFDLNGLPGAPTNAFLRLLPTSVPGTFTHSVGPVTSDAWGETSISWNNKPAAGAAIGSSSPRSNAYTSLNVTSAAASAFAGDKMLSLKVVSDTASTGAPVMYASREFDNPLARPMLVSSNLRPAITDIPRVETGVNTPAAGGWFGVWDAETPLASLNLSATSSNPTLLPVANITFGGTGIDRTLSLTPAAGQFGTSNVTITVTDAQGQTAQATFQFFVDASVPVNGDQQTPNQDDVIRVVRSGANLNIFRNGTLVIDQALATAPAYLINGLGGNDTLIVDYTGGNPVPAAGLSLDGGSGAADVVRVVGSSAADAVTLTAGNVALAAGGDFDYANGETLELQFGPGHDTLMTTASTVTAGTLLLNLSGSGGLTMAAGAALPDFTDLNVGAGTIYNLAGASQTIDALTGGGLVLNTGPANATLTVGAQSSSSTFTGSISPSAGAQTLSLTKVGAGTLTLTGSNSYTGTTTIAGGLIEAALASSFSGLPGPVQFLGGTFRPTATQTAANVLNKWTTTFAGATGTNTGTFDVPLGVTLTLGAAGGLAAVRTGGGTNAGGSFVKTGGGTLRLLTANPQQDDPLLLNAGTVVAQHADALGLDHAGVRVDMKSGTTLVLRNDAGTNFRTPVHAVDAAGTVDLVTDRQTPGNAVAHALGALSSAAVFGLNVSAGPNVTGGVAALAFASAPLGGNATIDAGANTVVSFAGAVGGPAGTGVTKTGPGTLLLNGVNTNAGATAVNAGTLGGAGTIAGDLNNASVVAPGTSPGVLTVAGNYTQTAAGTLQLELNGAAGTEHDRLAVAGTATLAGQLAVSLGFAPAAGQSFVVLDNPGGDPVAGTFAGLPEAATLSAGGHALRVSYIGGDGNDVTLTAVAPAVTDVFVSGSAWTANFLNFLSASGTGHAAFGYRVSEAEQTDELPWINLDRISLRFSGPLDLAAGDLAIRGVNVPTYAFASTNAFTYDATTFTATWTLAAPVANDKLLLDLSAAGFGGFTYRLNVLPGDVNRSGGSVVGSDVTLVRNSQNFSPGSSGYGIYRDVNGSGSILGSDVTAVRNRQGFRLPTEDPT